MSQQGSFERRQLLVGHQPPEAFLGFHHAGSGPAQGHRGIPPALHVAADLPDGAVHVLDDVGAGQRAAQLPRQPQADDTQDLIQSLQDGGGDAGPLLVQPPRQVPDQLLGPGGILHLPGLSESLAHRGLRLLGQTLGNVAGLVNLAALDRRVLAKRATDRLGQGLGAVDDEQPHHRRIEAALDQAVEQRLNRGGILGGPLDQPQRVLFPRGVDADRRDQDQVLLDMQIWIASRSRDDRSLASQSFSFALDSATNLRDTADFEVPSPLIETTSPSGRRTERWNRRVETLMSIWVIAPWPRQFSRWPPARLGSSSSRWPSGVRTRGRSMATRPP